MPTINHNPSPVPASNKGMGEFCAANGHYFGKRASKKWTASIYPGAAIYELKLSAQCLECGAALGDVLEHELQPAVYFERRLAYIHTVARKYRAVQVTGTTSVNPPSPTTLRWETTR